MIKKWGKFQIFKLKLHNKMIYKQRMKINRYKHQHHHLIAKIYYTN